MNTLLNMPVIHLAALLDLVILAGLVLAALRRYFYVRGGR